MLPLVNLSADPENEFLSDGITEEIISTLSRQRAIRVAARASSFAFKHSRPSLQEVAEQLGVTSILDGSVQARRQSRARGDAARRRRVRVSRLVRPLRSRFDDVFAIQDDIATAVADALSATLLHDSGPWARDSVAGCGIRALPPRPLRAEQAHRSRAPLAAEHFPPPPRNRPTIRSRTLGSADARLLLGVYGAESPATDVFPLAREATTEALRLDPSLGERHATLGARARRCIEWDWTAAGETFRRAVALSPRSPTAWQWRAMHHLLPLGRFDDARVAIDRARRSIRCRWRSRRALRVVYHLSGDSAGAVRALRRRVELDASFADDLLLPRRRAPRLGDTAAAIDAFKRRSRSRAEGRRR